MPELVFFRRGEEVLRLSLGEERVILGRGDRCDVVIPDPQVSRQHVALHMEEGRCILQDLSGKGAEVAGKKLELGEIPDGADIALGQWQALYRRSSGTTDSEATEQAHRTELVTQADASESPRLPAQVRVRTGSQEQTLRLQTEAFTVGKDAGNDLVLNQRIVSGRHARVTRKHNRFQVVDQRSTNGTWLQNVRLFEAEVPFFTTLRIGESELTLEPQGTRGDSAVNTHGLVGTDPALRSLVELIERVAPSSAAISIFGESGTGKELVARALHNASARASAQFIPVNCAAISKELIESELFGHEKGSFTGATGARKGAFEEADGGTLFLDEIGELPLDLQAKLLRALESGEIKRVGASRPINVDTRIVTATNRDLLAMAHEGRFREDLYYRLCVIPLTLPPLRNRPTDVRLLAEHFVRLHAPKGVRVIVTEEAMKALEGHPWPGNVRELRNVIHRALLLRRGPNIDATDLKFDGVPNRPMSASTNVLEHTPGMTLEAQLARAERSIVESALKRLNGNREQASRELNVSRSTLFKRLKEWGLSDE